MSADEPCWISAADLAAAIRTKTVSRVGGS